MKCRYTSLAVMFDGFCIVYLNETALIFHKRGESWRKYWGVPMKIGLVVKFFKTFFIEFQAFVTHPQICENITPKGNKFVSNWAVRLNLFIKNSKTKHFGLTHRVKMCTLNLWVMDWILNLRQVAWRGMIFLFQRPLSISLVFSTKRLLLSLKDWILETSKKKNALM